MAVIRRRYLFWLIKAYIKRWGKQFFLFFLIGLGIFLLLVNFYPLLLQLIPTHRKTIIGISGAYRTENMPSFIVNKIAKGLTKVSQGGTISPDLASSWKISNKGKRYTFYLKKDITFSDGEPFTSDKVSYSFSKVTIKKPSPYTIEFNLKEPYAPFLVTVSRPIFYKNLIGVGDYKIHKLELNGEFLKTIQLVSRKDSLQNETYIFYPTIDALKTAMALGEITKIARVNTVTLQTVDFSKFQNISIKKQVNYGTLVTLFYNTQDPLLSDKKIRNGLTYALPDTFGEGIRTYNPYPPKSKYSNPDTAARRQDLNHASLLVSSALEQASASAKPKITITSLEKYKTTAETISKAWEKLGFIVTINDADTIPDQFQVFLGEFNVPKDPDQYTLWHSAQANNITKLRNLRIDKLLEDGRKTVDDEERIKIYTDFQKYLLDEAPASFLYFPQEYELIRK